MNAMSLYHKCFLPRVRIILGLALMNTLQILKAGMVEKQSLWQLHRTTVFNAYSKVHGFDPFCSEASDNPNGDEDAQTPLWRSLCMATMLTEALDIRGLLARVTISMETFK